MTRYIKAMAIGMITAISASGQLENEFAYDTIILDDTKLMFGTDRDFQELFDSTDARLEWRDSAGNDMMRLTDAGTTGDLHVTGNITFGGSLSGSLKLPDDTDLIFGTDNDIQIRYDEAGDDRMEFHDGTNLLGFLSDAGTSGNFGVTGNLSANTIGLYSGTTATLYNTTATTVNAFGAATAITLGTTSGSATIRNPTITLAPGAVGTLLNQTGTQLEIRQTPAPGTTGLIDFNPMAPDGTSNAIFRVFRLTNTTGTRNVIYFTGTGGVDIGCQWVLRTAAQGGPLFTVWDGAAGASAIKITLTGLTGNATFAGDVAVNGGDLTTTATNFNLVNGASGTVGIGSSASAINIGANASTFSFANLNATATYTFTGLSMQIPSTLTTGATTANVFNTGTTTINIGGAATTLNAGAGSGATANLNFATLNSNQSSVTYFASPSTNTVFGNGATSTYRGLAKFAYDGTNNTTDDILVVRKTSNNDPSQVNMGAAIAFELENADSPGENKRAGRYTTYWQTATAGSETSSSHLNVMSSGSEITILQLLGFGSQGPEVRTNYDMIANKRFMYATATELTANDTTPSVSGGNIFRVPNTWTSGNNITNLDDAYDGQVVIIVGGDSDCTVVDGGSLVLAGDWTANSNATLILVYTTSKWIELSRSAN